MIFPHEALQPGVRRREVFSWALYDFGNSSYVAVVITSVYVTYFVGVVAQGQAWATLAWTLALSASHALVMLTSPALGRLADRHACKKTLLGVTTLGGVITTAALALPPPGAVAWALLAVLLSYSFYSWSESLMAAFLPELAEEGAVGRVSGWGASFGAIGGMVTLGACLAYVSWAQSRGLPAAASVPVCMLITAAMYGAPAVVTMLVLRERAAPRPRASPPQRSDVHFLGKALQTAREHPDFGRLLVCGAFYQAGVAVALSVSAIYANQVVGFRQDETLALILVLYFASAAGSFCWGYLQDRLGHKLALGLTLGGWMVTCGAVGASSTRLTFWCAALVAGVCIGACLSAGRAWVGALTPPGRSAEFFGLWTLVSRLASMVGPACYGVITWLSGGNHSLALLATTVFFALSLWALSRIGSPARPLGAGPA